MNLAARRAGRLLYLCVGDGSDSGAVAPAAQTGAVASACAGDILDRMNIPQEEVSILLINGFHHKPESEVKDGDIVALFPPVGGG